jgi:hypothetical protein
MIARSLRPSLLAALALACAPALGAMAPAAAGAQGCNPGAEALVTKVPGGEWYRSGGFSGQEHTYVCASGGGVTVEIGVPGNEMASSGGGLGPTVKHLIFAGLTAAVVYENETGSMGLDVIELADGHIHFHHGLGGGNVNSPGEHSSAGSHAVPAIVVKRDGSVAWVQQIKGSRYEVLKHQARTTVLDRSGEVKPKSLTLTGSKLRWVERDGSRRTATLM